MEKQYGIYGDIIDRESIRRRRAKPIILNHIKLDRDGWLKKTAIKVVSSELDTRPRFECEHYNINKYLGETCPKCGEVCQYSGNVALTSTLFLAPLDGVVGYLSPPAYYVLRSVFGIGRDNLDFSLIDYLMDTSVTVPAKSTLAAKKVKSLDAYLALGIKRGYNHFIANFESIMEKLIYPPGIPATLQLISQTDREARKKDLMDMVRLMAPNISCKHSPLPNSSCFVLEKKEAGYRLQTSASSILHQNAVNVIMSKTSTPDWDGKGLSAAQLRTNQNATARFVREQHKMYIELFSRTIGSKEGLARKDCLGVRPDGSFRTVVTSSSAQSYKCKSDVIELPWLAGVELYRPEIYNYLLKMEWTPKRITHHLQKHERKYCPILDDLMNVKYLGTKHFDAVLLNRNPILYPYSQQLVRVGRVKIDPLDLTTGLPALCLIAYNGDFDGDEYQGVRISDSYLAKLLEYMRLQYGALSRSGGGKHDGTFDLPESANTLLHAYTNIHE